MIQEQIEPLVTQHKQMSEISKRNDLETESNKEIFENTEHKVITGNEKVPKLAEEILETSDIKAVHKSVHDKDSTACVDGSKNVCSITALQSKLNKPDVTQQDIEIVDTSSNVKKVVKPKENKPDNNICKNKHELRYESTNKVLVTQMKKHSTETLTFRAQVARCYNICQKYYNKLDPEVKRILKS